MGQTFSLGSDVAGYDGQFCEGDRDDCVQQPCGEEAECVDNPAPMVGVTCVCPDGFNVTEDGTRCLGTCAGRASTSLCPSCIVSCSLDLQCRWRYESRNVQLA